MSDITQMGKEQYKNEIRARWVEVLDTAISYRKSYLTDVKNNLPILETYISQITELWLMLEAKMDKRTDEPKLAEEFASYAEYYHNPKKLIDDPDKIRLIEICLGKCLEKLKITDFEV